MYVLSGKPEDEEEEEEAEDGEESLSPNVWVSAKLVHVFLVSSPDPCLLWDCVSDFELSVKQQSDFFKRHYEVAEWVLRRRDASTQDHFTGYRCQV